MMTKLEALAMLSDAENLQAAQREAAERIGITYQAVAQWPDVLSPQIEDRVVAAWFRQSQRKALDQLLVGAHAKRLAAAGETVLPPAAVTTLPPAALAKKARRSKPTPEPAAAVPSEPALKTSVANPFRA